MQIKKASGKRESFSELKLERSLGRINLNQRYIDEIVQEVKGRIYSGISSKRILEMTLELLKKIDYVLAAKYNLKGAIMNLGPSGYPFERYFAGILDEYGYKTRVGEIVEGHCASQEIDVIAVKGKRHLMVECKYHNTPGSHSDLKVALYTYARFLDVKEVWERRDNKDVEVFHQAVLATNTRCTSEAVKFANCRGIKIIGWRYPDGQNLESMIEEKGLYPITILFSLQNSLRNKLLKKGVVFSKELIGFDFSDLGVSISEASILKKEAQLLSESSLK